jgi:two-component system, NtrC family, response regulator AtoC
MGKNLPNANAARGEDGPRQASRAFVEGVSASMRPVEAVIRELSQSDVPVLLLAETGAGKHATARRIHEMSRRSAQPFRCFQCSTVRPEDFEVVRSEAAANFGAGTIFLEELAELNASSQSHLRDMLLRASDKNSNGYWARLICGSSRDLEVEVKFGRLREDLYYRISGVCLRLPPLRQRKEDIPLLIAHFLRKYAEEFRRPVPELSTDMQRLFDEYSWPGNLRELESAVRVLVALGDERLAMGGLRALLRQPHSGNGGGTSLKAASRAASHEAEKELILKVLTRTRWNRRRAAEELQISYKALLYKLKQIGYEGYGA